MVEQFFYNFLHQALLHCTMRCRESNWNDCAMHAMNDMGNPDESRGWVWQPGDQGFHFEIPRLERVPVPPVQGRNGGRGQPSEMQASWVPDLHGRTLHEVQKEAARIKMGDHFTSLQQFDCCLHSLCVLNGRKAHAVKTQEDYHLRVCPFGSRVRGPWRRRGQDAPLNCQPNPAAPGDGLLEGIGDDHLAQGLRPRQEVQQIGQALDSNLQETLVNDSEVIGLGDGPP